MFTMSRAPASASSLSGGPGCQMSSQIGQADLHAVDLDERRPGALLEVADLVEDAVVGQVDLAVDGLHRAVGQDRRAVEDVVGALGEADDGDDVVHLGGDPVQRRAHVAQDVLLEQEVLGRVAAQRQLGEEHELRAGLARLAQPRAHERLVAGDVADDRVHLDQGEAHPVGGGGGVPRGAGLARVGTAAPGPGTACRARRRAAVLRAPVRGRPPAACTRSRSAPSRWSRRPSRSSMRVEVAEQAEGEAPVVAHDRDAERRCSARAGRPGRSARSRRPSGKSSNCGPGTFVTTRLKKRWRVCSRAAWLRIVGGAKSASCGEGLRADGLAGLLEVDHRRVDGVEGRARVLDADRQRRLHRGDAVAERAALGVGADGDRDHRPQHDALGRLRRARASSARAPSATEVRTASLSVPPKRVLDRLDVVEVGVDPRVAAVRADRDVERRRRRRAEARRGPSRPGRRPGRRAGGPRAAGARSTARTPRAISAGHGDALHERVGQELRCPSAAGAGSQARPGAATGVGSGAGVEEDRGDVDAARRRRRARGGSWRSSPSGACRPRRARPSTMFISHSGLERSSCWAKSRPPRRRELLVAARARAARCGARGSGC